MKREIKAAVKLLKANGYVIFEPPEETEYHKAVRTGVRPKIWPPIAMSREDLNHFRNAHGL